MTDKLTWEKPYAAATWLLRDGEIVANITCGAEGCDWRTSCGLSCGLLCGKAADEDAAKREVLQALRAIEQTYVTDAWLDYGYCTTLADVIAQQLCARHGAEAAWPLARQIAESLVRHFGAEKIGALCKANQPA